MEKELWKKEVVKIMTKVSEAQLGNELAWEEPNDEEHSCINCTNLIIINGNYDCKIRFAITELPPIHKTNKCQDYEEVR